MNPGGSSTEPLSWSDPSSWDLTMHSLNHPPQAQQHHNSAPAAPPVPAVSLSSKEWEISWQQPDHHHHHHHHHQQQHHGHSLYYPLQHHGHHGHHQQHPQQQPSSHELKPAAALILSTQHQQSPLLPRASYSSSSSSSSPHHQALLLPPGYTTYSSASATGGTSHHLQAMLQQQQQQQQQQRSHHSPATLALLHQNLSPGSSILELQHDPDQEQQTYQQRRSYFGLMDESQHAAQRSNLVGSGGSYVNYQSPGAVAAAAAQLKREEWSLSHQQEQQYHQQVAAANEWLHGRIGLNLGGRTYFSAEDSLIARFGKRPRLNGPSVHVPLCQAEGCTADLSKAKHYHRRHKVCELHSKAPNVVANGQTQRFCQQCSRFHLLTEFDDSKRSCRKRLADHNRRRRKPQPSNNNNNPTSSSGGGAGKTEQSSEGGADQPEASEATHSSADTKPTPLLLKSTSSPSGSREEKTLVHKTTGEEGEQSKLVSGVQNDGSRHHNSVQSTLSSSADIPLRGGQAMNHDHQIGGGVGVYSTNTGNQNQSSSTAANSGPNLSLSSSFGSSSQLLAMDQTNNNNNNSHNTNNTNVNNTRSNSGSQSSSIEQCSWLKSATTTTTTTAAAATTATTTTITTTIAGGSRTMNSLGSSANNCNYTNSSSGRPIRSHNFHDLISSHSNQQQLSTRSPVFAKALQPATYGATRGLNVEGSYSLVSSLGARATATTADTTTASTTEYFGISRNHGGGSNSGLEDHQVLSLLESRPLGVNAGGGGADMGFMQQLSKETIHDVDEEEETDEARTVVASQQHQQHEQQKHSSCGEFKFQEMQSLRGFYGSTGSLL